VNTLRPQWKQNYLVYNTKILSKVIPNAILFPHVAKHVSKLVSNAKTFSKGAGLGKSGYFGGGGCQDRSGNPQLTQSRYTKNPELTRPRVNHTIKQMSRLSELSMSKYTNYLLNCVKLLRDVVVFLFCYFYHCVLVHSEQLTYFYTASKVYFLIELSGAGYIS